MNYIKIEIKIDSQQQSEILIAELSEINFDAFEEKENYLQAFIKENFFNEEALQKITSPKNIYYTKQIIYETNWNAKWESDFQPIIVEDFVAVRAAFHASVTNVQHQIIITPKMSFGTGHHATTYLMLQQMQHLDFNNKTVLDFGTGTGILAILAKKLGAKKVIAIDNDDWSINNAKENFSANACTDVILIKKDNLVGIDNIDIVLANINLNVIKNAIGQLSATVHVSSHLLLSGFLRTDEENLIDIFTFANFTHISTDKKEEWLSMLLIKS